MSSNSGWLEWQLDCLEDCWALIRRWQVVGQRNMQEATSPEASLEHPTLPCPKDLPQPASKEQPNEHRRNDLVRMRAFREPHYSSRLARKVVNLLQTSFFSHSAGQPRRDHPRVLRGINKKVSYTKSISHKTSSIILLITMRRG